MNSCSGCQGNRCLETKVNFKDGGSVSVGLRVLGDVLNTGKYIHRILLSFKQIQARFI